MKGRNSGAVMIFIGILLTAVFAVGLAVVKNPHALNRPYQYDFALDQFGAFCASIWLPAGIIGIPLLVISLVVSLVRERKEKEKE